RPWCFRRYGCLYQEYLEPIFLEISSSETEPDYQNAWRLSRRRAGEYLAEKQLQCLTCARFLFLFHFAPHIDRTVYRYRPDAGQNHSLYFSPVLSFPPYLSHIDWLQHAAWLVLRSSGF